MQNENRNWIAFVVVAGLIFLAYQMFVIAPQEGQLKAAHARAEAVQAAQTAATTSHVAPPLTVARALAQAPRVAIDTPSLKGSLSLMGGRIDDLYLKGYHVAVSKTSPLVDLLRPAGASNAYFASVGWAGANLPGLPNDNTLWTLATPGALTPTHPIVLTHTTPAGLIFTRTIAIDDKFMFTLSDTVSNSSSAPVTLAPYVSVQRIGLPPDLGQSSLVHEGAIGVTVEDGKAKLELEKYKSWKKKGEEGWTSRGGWLGITDKYWMAAFIPNQAETVADKIRVAQDAAGNEIYDAAYLGAARVVAPGARSSETTHLFTGAKVDTLLKAYGASTGAPRFNDAIDWGWDWFLTKPISMLLNIFDHRVGNFGWAIVMLTLVIRLITFPLANKGYEMGVKMKRIQPELKAMQARLKEDPAAQQKEMMALYAREKVNPVTGCLPMFFQIPIFYALDKVFTVTIAARHAPFFGWIHDLSARDPTTIMNLFGLIPWDPAATPLIGGFLGGILHLGAWPIAYGCAIWLSQSMTPMQGIDPTQRLLFKFMPIGFTFFMAQYSVALLIYWTFSSLITILQQYVLMRRFKVDNPIDEMIARLTAKPLSSG